MIASVQAPWLRSQICAVFCASALFLGHGTVRAQESPSEDARAPSEASSVPGGTADAPQAAPAPEAPPTTSPEAVPAPLPGGEQNKPVYPRPYTPPQAPPSNREGPPRSPGLQPPASPHRARVPHEVDLPSEPDPDAFRHRGFFLRLSSGIGAGATRYHQPVHGETQSVQTRGVSTLFEFALGYAPIENLIVHGSAAFLNLYESRREVAGRQQNSPDIESGCALLGAGATYYFMPVNMYITATSGVVGFSESSRGRLTIESRAGVGGSLSLGKEWWIGRLGDWGVGAALRGSFNSMKAHIYGELERIYAGDIGFVFSATMN